MLQTSNMIWVILAVTSSYLSKIYEIIPLFQYVYKNIAIG